MFIQWHHGGLWFKPENDTEGQALTKIWSGIRELGLDKDYVLKSGDEELRSRIADLQSTS